MGSPSAGPRYVYIFRNAEDVCLYVGCTDALGRRMTAHAGARPWWPEVAQVEVTVHPDHNAGMAAEEAAIKALQPVHNRVFTEHWSNAGGWDTRRRNEAERRGRAS